MSFSGARSLKNLYPSVKLKLVPSPLSYSVQSLATSELQKTRSYRDRSELKDAKRIVVKLGSAVITRTDGKGLALGRLASIVEEIAECHHQGKYLLLVSSGAVAFGHQKLAHQVLPSMTDWESKPDKSKTKNLTTLLDTRVAAAVGQSELMAMYEALFSQYNVKIAQILVTKQDFFNQKTKDHLSGTLADLRSLNVVPILNTNDAVSPMFLKDDTLGSGKGFDGLYLKDNDSLSALLATETKSDLLILMSDMQGIYDKPPWEPGSRVISTFTTKERDTIKYSWKSKTGNSDMRDTVRASTWALDRGVSVVVCNGTAPKTISDIFRGKKIGTFFTDQSVATTAIGVEGLANKAREASKMLLYLNGHERSQAIHRLIQLFDAKRDEIIKVNETDLMLAERNGVASNLRQSLGMNKQKLDNLKSDLDSIAKMNLYYVGKSFRTTILADNLSLQQITVPIGVVLVLLESRPYLILEAAAMAIATANGLIIKSSRVAENTNNILMRIVREALKPLNAECAVSLASYAETTNELLEMRKHIDLVIPRGSHNFVESIKSQSKIPVLGTSEGVCTIYIDDQADYKKALEIIIHAKCDSPTDENSMDTLLIHEKHVNGVLFNDICNLFNKTNIKVRAGHKLRNKLSFIESTARSKQCEYEGLECSVEMVENVEDAIQYIGQFERAHTNSIVTENEAIAKRFLYSVDSACVFQNASTRLSNSAAFGLGPEIAFSTSKTPLRGPVGIEGLLTTKWIVEAKRDVINNQDVIM